MSSKITTNRQGGSGNGFVIDENGKYHLAPLRLPEFMSAPLSANKSSEKKCTKRKYIPIQPEKFNFPTFESSGSPALSKKRKIDKTSVRKELFTIPQRKSMRNSLSKQQLKFTKSNPAKKAPISRRTCQSSLVPLIEINDKESLECDEGFTLKLKSPLLNKINQCVTPLVDIDEAEEMKSDQIFIMNEIRAWIQEEKEEFENYQKQRQERLKKLEVLVNQFENNTAAPLGTSTKTSTGVLFSQSPDGAKKLDLRKIALNKHLKENIEYQAQSPRTKKALQMYNSFRYNYSVLCTPKFERTSVDPPQASAQKSLSRKIQKQCLLLQDTPKQKS